MEFRAYQNRLSQLSARFNLMVVLVFGLLISNLMLAGLVCFTTYNQKIEVTPFFGGEGYSKSATTIDAHYLGLMSENFIYSKLNITPETVSSNYQRLLTYVDGAHYSQMFASLKHEEQLVKAKKISSQFVITDIRLDMKTLTADVSGVLQRHVGLRAIEPENLKYRLSYRYQLGHLTLLRFNQVKESDHA